MMNFHSKFKSEFDPDLSTPVVKAIVKTFSFQPLKCAFTYTLKSLSPLIH